MRNVHTHDHQPILSLTYNMFFQNLENLCNPNIAAWVTAVDHAVNEIKPLLEGTKFYDALIIAKDTFIDSYKMKINGISSLEKAAYAVQSLKFNTYSGFTSEQLFDDKVS